MARARDVLRFYRDFSADLPDEAEVHAALATSPDGDSISPLTGMVFFRVHGAATRVPSGATAFGLHREQWDFNIISQGTEARETDAQIAWTRALWSRLEPLISGSAYVNHLTGDDRPEKVRASLVPITSGFRH
jgi:hypothetical protein